MTTVDKTARCPYVDDFDGQLEVTVPSDPYDVVRQYRERDPFWADNDPNEPEGGWVVTKFDQIVEIQKDYRTFTHVTREPAFMANPLMPSFFDPPLQTKLRAIILPLMSAERISTLEPRMHEVCRTLIASFKDRGRCEAIAEFSQQYPIRIFGDLYGLPEARRQEFRQLAETFLHHVDQRATAWMAIQAIMRDELEQRRLHPQDDMLNGIAHGTIDGELVTIDVAVNLASTVFVGGLDTLPSNIGWTLRYLADRDDQRRLLVEHPDLIAGAVEEFFRMFPSVVRNNVCYATRDVDFHGANIKEGDRVHTWIALANVDSSLFDDPLAVDFRRENNKHMAFSVGSHRCLGSHLARHELGVALTEWLAAIPEFHVAEQADVQYSGGAIYSLKRLPLTWDPAPATT